MLKAAYLKFNNFLGGNRFLNEIIRIQHKFFPMPLKLFYWLFHLKPSRLLFSFYGRQVFLSSYKQRKDNLDYWLSKKSLYWHFYHQLDAPQRILDEVFSLAPVQKIFSNPAYVAAELGFGIGKSYNYKIKEYSRNLREYLAVEPNAYLQEYLQKTIREKNFVPLKFTIEEFMADDRRFDILIVCDGVFMFLKKNFVDQFFQQLPTKGVETAIIVNEGTSGDDIVRPDNTTMYNFKRRLQDAGFKNKNFIEKINNHGVYEYFIMF